MGAGGKDDAEAKQDFSQSIMYRPWNRDFPSLNILFLHLLLENKSDPLILQFKKLEKEGLN